MNIPEDILSAINRQAVAHGQGLQGTIIAYTDQPTVTVKLASGEQRHMVLGVFRREWTVDPEPTEYAQGLVEEALRRNIDDTAIGPIGGAEMIEFARQVGRQVAARLEAELS